ncbi:5-formyltetrahydrofolate cyclo-ligase [Candidatus Peregrinibacteria bacterium]|nr:5-formyltetrahydrofolate cyclo-ligase [Candidatus Peregrinibacteria bacterium]
MSDKKEIRSKLLEIRRSLPIVQRNQKSKVICDKLEELAVFQNSDHILFYYSFDTEVDTIPIINKYVKEKRIYLPRLISENQFVALPFHNFDTLKQSSFQIPEPIKKEDEESYESRLDLIIVPGVGFDKNGNRIGMGKGYYDRYLAKLPHTPKVALAFENQVLESIPKEKYDESVNIIITEENIYNCDL